MPQNMCQCQICLAEGLVCYTKPRAGKPLCKDCKNNIHAAVVARDRAAVFNANGNTIIFGTDPHPTYGAEHGC